MRHQSRLRRCALLAPVAMAGLLVASNSFAAASIEATCQDAVAKAGTKYFSSLTKVLSACEEGRSDGSITPATNCRPSVGPIGDAGTAASVTKAQDKLASSIAKKCAAADFSLMTFGVPCQSATNVDGLSNCIRDDGHGDDAEDLVETIFDASAPVTGDASIDCQADTAKAAAKFAVTRLKGRNKCAKLLASGKVALCPDAKTNAKFDKAVGKLKSSIEKTCTTAALTNLDFGFPCDLYIDSTYQRGTNITQATRFSRCMAAASAGAGDSGAETAQPIADAAPFENGVQAGDMTDTQVVVWTRSSSNVDVNLEVSTDVAFGSLVNTDTLTPDALADNTVHATVTGLTASTVYFYRFKSGASTSRVGKVKTAPAAASTASLTFGFTGDANAFFKPYAVLEQITEAAPDSWFFIGDTIYGDDPRSGTGAGQVRSDYHVKYKENREDRAMRDLTANVGTYTIWDDHEVTNDFWGTDPAIAAQMVEGNEAFRDYSPMTVNNSDSMQLYRSFKWGDVAEFFLIDCRQYRSAQADITEPQCVTGVCSTALTDCHVDGDCPLLETCLKGTCSDDASECNANADCNVSATCSQNQGDTTPNATCQTEIDNPARTYLGATQLAWLESGIASSTATWKFIMNGPVITALSNLVPYDRWEGYTTERDALLNFIDTNADNVVFLSTDIHGAIVDDDVSGSGNIHELVAGAIGMDPIIRELPPEIVPLIGSLPLILTNVSFFDIDRFNVTTASVSQTELKMTWYDGSGQVLKGLTLAAN